MSGSSLFRTVAHCFRTIVPVVIDLIRLAFLAVHLRRALAAENLFLRKQLALFQERQVKPRRANDSTRWMMATLSRMFPWCDALVNVKASTLIRWHRQGFRRFWRWKSKPMGRPRLPRDLRRLIREMAAENATWGEERIANELKLKLESGSHPAPWRTICETAVRRARPIPSSAADLHPQPCQGHCGL